MPAQGLDHLRYLKFFNKVQTRKTAVYSYRVYVQVQAWLGKNLSPVEWGWIEVNNKLIPVRMTLPAAPDRLLKIIRCCCKQNCDSSRCTCKKYGLHCTPACGDCHGLSCSNRDELSEDTLQE